MAIQIIFSTLIILFIPGTLDAHGVPYDHSFTHECLGKPLEPQYGGGIVVTPVPGQSEESKGWIQVGNAGQKQDSGVAAKFGHQDHATPKFNFWKPKNLLHFWFHSKVDWSRVGNAGQKTDSVLAAKFGDLESAVLKFQLEEDKLYAFSAWVQASHGNSYVQAVFRTNNNNVTAGWVAASEGCWSMLKGGLVVNASGPAELYFRRDNTSTADIWAASISLQPFTLEEWKSHQDQSIEKARKGKVKFVVVNENGQPIPNASVSIKQTRPDFPLGSAMNSYTLLNETYRNWFLSRFKYYTVFENEFRWPYVALMSYEDYSHLDTLFNFTKSHGLAVRGHPVHTSAMGAQPTWIDNSTIADTEHLRSLVNERTKSLIKRYAGQVIHWDVVNENMHDNFFDAVLGDNASSLQYQLAHEIDPATPLYLNEYFTIEDSEDELASPWKYLQKVWKIQEQGYKGPLGIGVAGRFYGMNLPYTRASLDVLESAKLPLWITELLVYGNTTGSNQAIYLEQIMRELYAHRAVDGIMMWAAMWANGRCWRMCLTDSNFVNLPTGDVVDKIMAEWTYASGIQATTGTDGCFQTSLFYGEYEAQVNLPTVQTPTGSCKFKVAPQDAGAEDVPFLVTIRA